MSLRIGSLCTGYGGLDMAVTDTLDATVAWHCQYDPEDKHQYAARILEHHWPEVPNHGDITRVDWAQVEPIDILTAGFPCQDLSYAGRGAGIKEGTRSGLWYAVADAIGALRPGLVVLENVRAIVNRRPGLDVVLASLADLGFDAEWESVRAADVGAPHERWRWFLLAWPADSGRQGWEGRRLQGPVAQRGGAAADAHDQRGHRSRACGAGRDEPAAHDLAAADPGGDGRERSAECHRGPEAGIQAPRWNDPVGRVLDWDKYAPAVHRWEAILGRPAPRPTEPGRTGDRLSPLFVEWMMGLPAGHVTDVPAPPGMRPAGLRNARLKALGNGVVRQQAAHALHILLDRAPQEVSA